jgi:hypothetical protein
VASINSCLACMKGGFNQFMPCMYERWLQSIHALHV